MFAEGAILVADRRSAELLHPLLAPYAGQVGFDGVTAMGSLEHYLGGLATVLGHHDEAVERLRRSCEVHVRIEAPFYEARSHHQLAAALLARNERGDADAARVELRHAVELAERHRYRMVHRRAAQLLANTNGV